MLTTLLVIYAAGAAATYVYQTARGKDSDHAMKAAAGWPAHHPLKVAKWLYAEIRKR